MVISPTDTPADLFYLAAVGEIIVDSSFKFRAQLGFGRRLLQGSGPGQVVQTVYYGGFLRCGPAEAQAELGVDYQLSHTGRTVVGGVE